MAKGFNIYLDPTESCSQADIEAMCKAINPPVGWERFPNNNGIGVYAANVFDPHIDMDEYLCNISVTVLKVSMKCCMKSIPI